MNFQLLSGLFRPSLLTGAPFSALAGPRLTGAGASTQWETFGSNLP